MMIVMKESLEIFKNIMNERFNKKIMNSNIMKNPYSLIIGDNERDNNLVSFRKYNSDETVSMSLEDFIKYIKDEIKKR